MRAPKVPKFFAEESSALGESDRPKTPKFFSSDTSTTRHRSTKQEKYLAKKLKMKTTVNSGATFNENDLKGVHWEIEAKTTKSKQYILKISDWEKMNRKLKGERDGCMVISFEGSDIELAVVSLQTLEHIIK